MDNAKPLLTQKLTQGLTQEQRINRETARIRWQDLQRYFAGGVLVVIEKNLDFVDSATRFIKDDRDQIKDRMDEGAIRKATDQDAKRWDRENAELWAVVVAPWVLVQEID